MMKCFRFVRAFLVAAMMLGVPALSLAQQQPPKAPEGFVPVDQVPGQEELPAKPLVAAAYGVAWLAVLIYVFSIWKRLNAVEREMADIARRIEAGGRR
jgi:CcmD family protein